jgi:isoamylase
MAVTLSGIAPVARDAEGNPAREPERPFAVSAGSPHPVGATVRADGVNFSVYSERASSVELLLFAHAGAAEPVQVIPLDARENHTPPFWHVFVRDLRPGFYYAYRVDGPRDLHGRGDRFNPAKALLDPYARGVDMTLWDRGAACTPDDNLAASIRGAIIRTDTYDWEGDTPINRPMHETVIYEVHVGGFTRDNSSGSLRPGTFTALAERIPYLRALGITAVELLPVFQFDPGEYGGTNPLTGAPLSNYWGYSTVGFFAPHSGYCVQSAEVQYVTEFRDMVKALHRAGIEVILDVVFNHTSEGNHQGPTMHFKGLENRTYYYLTPEDRQYYMDYSGTGNTVNCNHPVTKKLIIDCLEYWVREMHVDGFRFDEGSILSRGENGEPLQYPPVVWDIELSETLAKTKVIAEAWDAAGLYQIGYFPGVRWAEWNGRYRDDIRRFVRGDAGLVGAVAARILGSADIYQHGDRMPVSSINFVTAHDGFTLHDLVTYREKHNEANGEGNRDGLDDNDSDNGGIEGETDDPAVNEYRSRQIKNFAAILLLSQGVPMLLGGDEIRRTQGGNNNAFCQDSPISWFDWSRSVTHADTLRFFQRMIDFRHRHPILRRDIYLTGTVNARGLADIAWHGARLLEPGWDDPGSRVLSFTVGDPDDGEDIHVILNMDPDAIPFQLPAVPGRRWYRAADTALASPDDIVDVGSEAPVTTDDYLATSHSVVVLVSKAPGETAPEEASGAAESTG